MVDNVSKDKKNRLIYTGNLVEEIESLRVTVTGLRAGKGILIEYMKQFRESVLRIIDEQPDVDTVEVVHGRWNRTDYPEFIMGDFECSACEYLECDVDTSCLLPGVNCLYYCPNCGAKMDGGGAGGGRNAV